MPPNIKALLSTALVIALIGFVLYRRVRGSIGRQKLQPTRFKVRMIILGLVCVAILASEAVDWRLAAGVAAGAAAGLLLAFYALKHTRMEFTPEGTFYTGHPLIGVVVIGLVGGRIVYRIVQVMSLQAAAHTSGMTPHASFASTFSSPVTVAFYFVMVAYYAGYYIGLLRRAYTEAPREAVLNPTQP